MYAYFLSIVIGLKDVSSKFNVIRGEDQMTTGIEVRKNHEQVVFHKLEWRNCTWPYVMLQRCYPGFGHDVVAADSEFLRENLQEEVVNHLSNHINSLHVSDEMARSISSGLYTP